MNRQYVEDRIVEVDPLPFTWNVETPGPHYVLCLKMSRLKQLAFNFEFGSVDPRQSFPKTEFPERIVKLDISLNELQEIPPEALFPFENLAELDASLNALSTTRGMGPLPNLVALNLSYNAIGEVKELENCPRLSVLHMSHNRLRSLTEIPLLSNLTRLNLSSNQLESLEGVQNLPRLCQLHVRNNRIATLLPLASSLSLNVLCASGNDIGGLPEALHVLRGLRRLKHLTLKDNPVARDNRYTTAIKESTSVEILDGMFLHDPPSLSALPLHMWPLLREPASSSTDIAQAKADLKEAARRAFSARLQRRRDDVGSAVHHFHSRILELQEELTGYEERLRLELDGCERFIQTLPSEDFRKLDNPQEIAEAMDKYLFTKFWEKWQRGQRKPACLPYKELSKPEDVVNAAAHLLSNLPCCVSPTI
ncbi:dynein axonemal assembly factor 1-like [Podarcis raffonei]|uniref:dynein axonemal assembly factor 1-like n=1 Tax=Podarcis raffonei TaxID=65483 RepID=UPI0023292ED5|nr:dynein axonemal assembly factor 1-like [Podarcis raffonei]